TNRFIFEGFVPPKESARQRTFERWVREERTVVYYESSHRIMASLVGLAKVVGAERQVVVGRELTKVFETFYRGALSDVIVTMRADANAQKGEFVVLLDGAAAHDSSSAEIELDALLTALLQEVPVSQAVRLAQAVTGERKNTIYQRAIALDAEIE
ncbi:MAG: rRNA (cytidine-2'-O-)-methyltransferase, partial [Gammaproteobacteria bacterium]|nr:rRNA (cytidine-2'-O-)-methyltransferase [Gammaproteobacteria bacterium]